MRADLRALSPVLLQEQLRSRGFHLHANDGCFVVYRRADREVDVPLHADFADYPRRVEELIGIVAALEGVPPADLTGALLQAADDAIVLRRHASGPFEVVGYVTRLDRSTAPQDSGGDVMLTPTEGDARDLGGVTVRLAQEAYMEAIEAHRQGAKVRVLGTLEKKGRRWTLSEPTGFERLPDVNDDGG